SPRTLVFFLLVLVLILILFVVLALLVVILVVRVLLFLVHAALGLGDLGGQLGRLVGTQQDLFLLHTAVAPQLEHTLGEQEHAMLAAGLDRRVDAVGLVFADQVLHGGRDDKHLVSGDQAFRLARQQGLREDADQGGGQLRADLGLLLLGEHVDNAVDGAG